jgi:hypothetical protein
MRVRARVVVALLGMLPAVVASLPESGAGGATRTSHYRGRVVELLTERPIPGALVAFAWFWTPEQETAWWSWAYEETLTDHTGSFWIDASAVEADMPPAARMPRMLVYKPGYATLPRERSVLFGVPAARLTAEGGVVALRPLKDLQERIDAFNLVMGSWSRLKGPRGPRREDVSRLMQEEDAELWRLIRREAPKGGG